jgi:hypothetical protein
MQVYIADVRKRLNADASMTHQAIPEARTFSTDAGDSADAQSYKKILATFKKFAPETPDEPVACELPGCDGVTMEWSAGPSEGQIDFYAPVSGEDEPQRFLSLYALSGLKPAEDRRAMKPLEQYTDFSQCLNFPLMLSVVDDPLAHPAQHQYLQSLRTSVLPLITAFFKTYFAPLA